MEAEIIELIMGMALLTFFTRFAFVIAFKKAKISEKWNATMIYVPIAIFTAIIVPALLLPKEELDFSIRNEYLIAGGISFLLAYKTKNLVGTVIIGISIIILLRFALGF